MPEDEAATYVTIKDFMFMSGVSRGTVNNMTKDGRLRSKKFADRTMIDAMSAKVFLKAQPKMDPEGSFQVGNFGTIHSVTGVPVRIITKPIRMESADVFSAIGLDAKSRLYDLEWDVAFWVPLPGEENHDVYGSHLYRIRERFVQD